MSAPDIHFGAGDTAPVIIDKLYGSDGNPLDLSGVGTTVVIRYRDKDQLAPEVTETVAITQTADVATTGDIAWTPSGARAAGDFNSNWIVTLTGGLILTIPNDRYMWMLVQAKP